METEQTAKTETRINYAGFGKRYAAMIIDGVILTFFCSPLYWEFQKRLEFYTNRMGKKRSYDLLNDFDRFDVMSLNYYIIFTFIVAWCYHAGMESSPWKATLGKKLLGLEVSDEQGNRVSFTKASGRHFGKILSGIVFYIGYLVMLGNNKKQTWHDSMSGCIVIEK